MATIRATLMMRGQDRLNEMRKEVSRVLRPLQGLRAKYPDPRGDRGAEHDAVLDIVTLPGASLPDVWMFQVTPESAYAYCTTNEEVTEHDPRREYMEVQYDAEAFPPEAVIAFHSKLDKIIEFFLKHTRDRPEIGQLLSTLEKLGEDE